MTLPRGLGRALALLLVLGAVPAAAPQARPQPATGDHQADFPPEEFRARWRSFFDRIAPGAYLLIDGIENFSSFVPADLDAIEAVVRQGGILQSAPALTEAGFEALLAGR
jgi:hypothetical protein